MKKREKLCMVIGSLFLAAALLLTGYNLHRDTSAGSSANAAFERLYPLIQGRADSAAASGDTSEKPYIPDYVLNPQMPMPEETIDGRSYIGVLEIPSLSLQLPVIGSWSYAELREAPCRYAGSAYQKNMVIAGHNYSSHFGNLKNLSQGDTVIFTDVDGNRFHYRVIELETLAPDAVDDLTSGDWDLTLFTCTIGGRSRVTVRCSEVAGH